MSKIRINWIVSLLFVLLPAVFLSGNYYSIGAEELAAPSGKVIVDMTKAEAAERFGNPDLSTDDFWYYLKPEPFFIYFSGNVPVALYLYPELSQVSVGDTVELRAFGYSSGFTLRDVSAEVEFLFNKPEDFIKAKPGLFIPSKPGEYQVVAKYNDVFSSPAYITVKNVEPSEEDYEKLVAIDILPFKPVVHSGNSVDFVALGTFIVSPGKRYVIKDISRRAQWFIQDGRTIAPSGDTRIYFVSTGTYKVFCKYQNTQSYPQEVSVRTLSAPQDQVLKHITVIPEFISASTAKSTNFRAFGTYSNNRIDDITNRVSWDISDPQVATPRGDGEFTTGPVRGVAEITAKLDNIKSPSAKLALFTSQDKSSRLKDKAWGEDEGAADTTGMQDEDSVQKHPEPDTAGGQVTMPERSIFKQAKKLLRIKIEPEYLTIPIGQEATARAVGVYSDNSQDDLVTLCEWATSDSKVAGVNKGRVSAIFPGEAKITAQFQGKTSSPLQVTVGEAGLISIIVSPRDSRISMEDKIKLEAQGHFTDSSRKDITAFVSWKTDKPGIVSIIKGGVRPLRIGRVIVYAEYMKIKSLPVSIKVVLTLKWLLLLLLKIILFFLLLLSLVFVIFYFLTEAKKSRLRSLINNNPRGFIICLYAEARGLLAIFGVRDDACKPHIAYALSVEEKYRIYGNLFLKFASRFSEAKYSLHAFRPDDAREALEEYRKFSRMIFSVYAKPSLYLRLSLALLRRIPVF